MSYKDKVKTIEQVKACTGGLRVVLCHGVFDLLHPGHLDHLFEASSLGDCLVVSLTEDEFVAKAKGKGHPRIPARLRAEALAALEFVDFVVIDNAPTPVGNLALLQPAVYCKGADYKQEDGSPSEALQQIELPVLESYGGELCFTKGTVTYSSTALHKHLKVGPYHKDPEAYRALVEETYSKVPAMELPVEFARTIPDNLLMLTVRLARYKFLARMLQPTDHVLEVGCGYGLGAIFLSQFCEWVTGVDVQEHCVDQAWRFCPRDNVRFICRDFLLDDKPAVAGDYNVVAALDVIEHLTPEQGRKLIHKMEGCLSSSGMLVLGTPSVYSAPYQSDFSQLSHVHCYDRDELLEVLKEHFGRVLCFSMNDEVVHTGHPKLAWYYFFLCFNAHSKGA